MAVALEEIEGAHGLRIDVNTLGAELKCFIKSVNARKPTKYITSNSSYSYICSLFKRVNRKEDGYETQRKNIGTVLVKLSSIRNNRARQSDPSLAWLMFHQIAQIYRDIRKQESEEEHG